MPVLSPKTTPYYGGGQVPNPADVLVGSGAPSANDIEHNLGTLYVDKTNVQLYALLSKVGGVAGWELIQAGSESHPITPFVVGSTGGYATVQGGIDAADAAGGGLVFVQDGTYTEDLGFAGGTSIVLWGSSAVEIIGNHIPPTTGFLELRGIKFTATSGAAFVSLAAGTTDLRFLDLIFDVTNGAVLDVPNWAGDIYMDGIQDISASSTFDVGAGDLLIKNSSLGTNTAGTNGIAGDAQLLSSVLGGAITISGAGTSVTSDSLQVTGRFLLTDTSTISMTNCIMTSGAASCVGIGSGCTASLYDCIFDSTDTFAIDGTGDLSYGLITFLQTADIDTGLNSIGTVPAKSGSFDIRGYLSMRAQTVTDGAGSVTLTNGVATVLNTNILDGDKIFFQVQSINGSSAMGIPTYAINAGVSFVVTSVQVGTPASTQTGDQSILEYFIVRPS